MDSSLIPLLYDWEIDLLQKNGSSFLMCVYDATSKKLVGSFIGERMNAIRFDKAEGLSCRVLRYIIDDEPHHCCICERVDKYEGWLWVQNIEFFVCIGCAQKN